MLEQVTTKDTQQERLEPFVISVPVVSPHILGKDVKKIFEEKAELEGLVVLDNEVPVGIIMRIAFYQKLSSLYGNSLFMERSIKIMMDTQLLAVDIEDTVSNISISAMNRPQSHLYDYIIVMRGTHYAGVISIRKFLVELSSRNEAQIRVLEEQQEKLLEQSRQELALKNDIIEKSNTIKNILNHAGQGFLIFDHGMVIGSEFSAECTRIFRRPIGGLDYLTLISPYFPPDKQPVFTATLDSFFNAESDITDAIYLTLLPQETVVEDKNIHFSYKKIYNGGKKSVMVVLNDISQRKAMEKSMQEERAVQRLVVKALTNRRQIRHTIDEFCRHFENGYEGFISQLGGDCCASESCRQLYRAVHTYKGDFAQNGFSHTSSRLHQFEERLGELSQDGNLSDSQLKELMDGLIPRELLDGDLSVVASILGSAYFEGDDTLTIPQQRLVQLEQQVTDEDAVLTGRQVSEMLASLRHQNLTGMLSQYEDYLTYLAQRLLKPVPAFVAEGDTIYLDPARYGDVMRSLVHIFRNIMDHGLEGDEERLLAAKPERGVVLCRVQRLQDGFFTLSISDDGRGIDTNRLREKALALGLCGEQRLDGMTPQQLTDLIFLDRLSTKDTADSLSGRGVGMAAVKQACEALGGSLAVASQPGQGTTFTLTLPL